MSQKNKRAIDMFVQHKDLIDMFVTYIFVYDFQTSQRGERTLL